MSPFILLIVSASFLWIMYHVYGTFIAKKIVKIDPQAPVPAHAQYDGKDYVPSSKQVMFGHHFTSIAGTGPIVGPAIGIIWGWIPACLWVLCGSVFMGAVHDFGALIISMRHQGRSLSDIAGDYMSPRVRFCFFIIVLLALWIVIAIFGLIIALIFAKFPSSVLAVWLEIPLAIAFGFWIKRSNLPFWLKTLVSTILLYTCIYIGILVPIELPGLFGLPATGLWTLILLAYAFIASILPVSLLLQPRDYLNAWQLYVALALIVGGIIVCSILGELNFVAPAINTNPTGAPSMWPFLFITIACGALSGFHCLICSGTSAKQINSEADAQYVGYGSMLMEAGLALVVIIAVGAGLGLAYHSGSDTLFGTQAFQAHYGSWQASAGLGSKLSAVVIGCSNMMARLNIPIEFGIAIVGVFIASFAGTTLDSATRVQRYIISECGVYLKKSWIQHKYGATAISVISAALLAFSSGMNGKGALELWPLFGAVNQLLGGLALLVITVYLSKRAKYAIVVTGIPCLTVLAITLWATIINQRQFWVNDQWLLLIVNSIIISLAITICIEGVTVLTQLLVKKRQKVMA